MMKMMMALLLASMALVTSVVSAQQQQDQLKRSLRGSSELKRVPLAAETEQFEATQGDESEHITAKLETAHAQKHVIPSLSWTPIVPMEDGDLK